MAATAIGSAAALLFGSVRAQRQAEELPGEESPAETSVDVRIGSPVASNLSENDGNISSPVVLPGTRLQTESSDERLTVQASRKDDTLRVLLTSEAEAKLRANVAIPLDRGVWSVERRLLGSPAGPAYSSERQQSAYASVAGNRVKPVWIPPRGAALVELTRGGGKVTDALRAVRAGVALLNGSQRGASRRLRAPLMSATSHLARIAGGYRPRDRDVYLRDAHRAVLYVAHMRAIVANASRDSRSEPLRALLSRVQALEEALAEHCAGVNGIQTSTAIAWDDETQGEAIRVTISLTNGGDRPLSNLRLGLGGGSEAVAKPRECATFASLAPGHRVEAEFRLPAESKGSRIVSGITYVAYRSPIQLRSELNAEALGLSER